MTFTELVLRAAGALLYGRSEGEVGTYLVEEEGLIPETAWLIVKAAQVYLAHPPTE